MSIKLITDLDLMDEFARSMRTFWPLSESTEGLGSMEI